MLKMIVNGFNRGVNYLLNKWYRITILILVIIITLPIITNYLTFIRIPFLPTNQNSVWIGFFGSFFGSIIGGLLTLIGIYLTIKREHYEKIISNFGIKIRKVDEVSNSLEKLIDEIAKIENPVNHVDFVNRYHEEINNEILRKIREIKVLASEVNAELYYEISFIQKLLIETFNSYFENINHIIFNDESFGRDEEKNELKFKEELSKKHPHIWFEACDNIDTSLIQIENIRKSLEKEYWNANNLFGNTYKKIERVEREE
jgi:hypothetical protein